MRGHFITFEGGEGCGKSTQIRLLLERLSAEGRQTISVREPGGTAVGEVIRHLLKYHPDNAAMTPEAELLLFAASRAQLVRETILPALAAGKTVVADRFLDSTTVYQGSGRLLPAKTVRVINEFACADLRPDLTFLLDLDARTGLARAKARHPGREDRMEQAGEEFYESVRRAYLTLAAAEPARFVVLDAALPPEEIHARVLDSLNARLHGLFS